jgi:hypothetical protein
MRQVRVQGCLPTLLVLLALVALGVIAATAGLLVVAGTAALLVALGVVRSVRRALGGPGPRPPERPVVEVVPPGWLSSEEGPIVEAGARQPEASSDPGGGAAGPDGVGERTLPPGG